VSASTQDGAAGKDLEAQRCWFFVSLERWIDGTLELAQEIETTIKTGTSLGSKILNASKRMENPRSVEYAVA